MSRLVKFIFLLSESSKYWGYTKGTGMISPIQNMNPIMVVGDHFIRCNKEKTRGQHINTHPAAPGRHTTVNSRNKAQTKQTSSNAS